VKTRNEPTPLQCRIMHGKVYWPPILLRETWNYVSIWVGLSENQYWYDSFRKKKSISTDNKVHPAFHFTVGVIGLTISLISKQCVLYRR